MNKCNDLRFGFGKNWQRYIQKIDDFRIRRAKESLCYMLGVESLENKAFVDIGCGSGLFSLAARKLGASVYSFDYDLDSVGATLVLKERFSSEGSMWKIERGDILDNEYIKQLGSFDIVYSWGVLHHTGAMYRALENSISLLKPNGKLYIAIYNDQGGASRRWKSIKKLYNKSPIWIQKIILAIVIIYFESRYAIARLLRLQNPFPDWKKTENRELRGMTQWHDYIDWVGGYPFEVAKPEDIFNFCQDRGLRLEKLATQGGSHGCNEFVFARYSQ